MKRSPRAEKAPPARVAICLLGGFEAQFSSGRPLCFGTRKAQALLAYLVLHPARVHRRDTLAALLWGETTDARARGSLRHALYDLRKVLKPIPGVLRADSDTVALEGGRVDADALRLQRLLDEGSPAALEEAMALYRGDLLAGVSVDAEPWEAWLAEERERLRESVVGGLARLVEYQRAAGKLEVAIRTAQRVLSLDPLREPIHCAVMRMLAQLGRRGAALRQYQACVGALERELGVEPEAETRDVYRAILRQSAAGVRLAPTPMSRAGESPLIGRGAEIAQLGELVRQAAAGRGCVLAILGEAGIGKTRLLEELIARAERGGTRVIVGRAYESDQILLFGPVVDALRGAQLAADVELLDALGAGGRAELAHLLPELASDAAAFPAQVDYRRLFETIARLVAGLAARAPLVIALEDLHWADELTLRLVAFLARRTAGACVLVAVTAREEELADSAMLRYTLEDLGRAGQLVTLRPGPLSRDDTMSLVASLLPTAAAPRAGRVSDEVWARSEGNPFVAVEMVRELKERAPSERLALPRRVRDAIGRRFERLSGRARTALAAAAVIGRETELELLQRIGGFDDDAATSAVEELVRRQLLAGVGERIGFAHERIRDVAYEALSPWRRRRLHRRVAEAIEELHAHRLPELWEALAEHCERGETWTRAAGYHRRVAERAKRTYAYATAERSCRRAVACAERTGDARETIAAHELLGDIRSRRGDLEGANETYEAALAACATAADRRRIGNKLHRPRLTRRAGAELAFYEHGGGGETLLLTNPYIYGLEIFAPVLEQLCQEYRIITMDLRGSGNSAELPAGYTIADHAADTAAVIEAAGGGPVTAIGISKTGNMLVRLAVVAPALIKRLVLIGTPLDVTPGSMSLVRSETDDRFRAALRAGDLDVAMREFVATIVTDPDTGELAEHLNRSVARLSRATILANWAPDPTIDIASILGEVKVPTLILQGTADRRVSPAAAHHLARHIPGATLHLFEGCGHLPLFTATQEFCAVLRRFMAQV